MKQQIITRVVDLLHSVSFYNLDEAFQCNGLDIVSL